MSERKYKRSKKRSPKRTLPQYRHSDDLELIYPEYSHGYLPAELYKLTMEYVGKPYISYYDNGKVKEEGFLIEGRKDGVWITYHENGKVKSIENYYIDPRTEAKKDILHGPSKTFWKNGKLRTTGENKNNLPYGKELMFWPNGKKAQYTKWGDNEVAVKVINYNLQGERMRESDMEEWSNLYRKMNHRFYW